MKEKSTKNCVQYCSIGGQAVLEGVMMKGKTSMATSVRRPDGKIDVKTQRLTPSPTLQKIFKIPVLRGGVNLVLSLVQGIKVLMHSAEVAGLEEEQEDYEPNRFERWLSEKLHVQPMDVVAVVSVIVSLVLFIGLFILLPSLLASLLPKGMNRYLRALCEGGIRIAIFLAYMIAISAMKDIRRVFMYHGAEHKTIACYEHNLPLTPENAATQSRLHPRCGTAFLLIVMIVSVLIYGLFPFEIWWQRMLIRIAMLPVVAGVAYEVLKLLAKSEHPVVRALRAPGLALQRLTTREPSLEMLEVAISSFQEVLYMEGIQPRPEPPAAETEPPKEPEAPEETNGEKEEDHDAGTDNPAVAQ